MGIQRASRIEAGLRVKAAARGMQTIPLAAGAAKLPVIAQDTAGGRGDAWRGRLKIILRITDYHRTALNGRS
jgi:hypothetical protein